MSYKLNVLISIKIMTLVYYVLGVNSTWNNTIHSSSLPKKKVNLGLGPNITTRFGQNYQKIVLSIMYPSYYYPRSYIK